MSRRSGKQSKRMTETIWRRRAASLLLSFAMILTANASSLSSLFSYVRAEEEDPTSATVESAATIESAAIVESEGETASQEPLEAPSEVATSEETEVLAEGETEPTEHTEDESASEDLEEDMEEATEEVSVNTSEEEEVTLAPTEVEQEETSSETVAAPKEVITYQKKSASGVEVTATFEEGAFAEEVSLYVYDIDDQEALNLAAEKLAEENAVYDAVAVDIVFMTADGRELEPQEGYEVQVSISIPNRKKLEGDEFALLHVMEDETEEIEASVLTEKQAEFTAESFSIYIVTAIGEAEKDTVHDWLELVSFIIGPQVNGYVPNTERNPYLLRVGETFTVRGYSSSEKSIYIDSAYTNNHDHLSVVSQVGPTFDTAKQKWYHEVTYHADTNGMARIKFDDGSSSNTIYVAVFTPGDGKTLDMFSDASLIQYNDSKNPYVMFDEEQFYIKTSTTCTVIDQNGNQTFNNPVLEIQSNSQSGSVVTRKYKAKRRDGNNNTVYSGGLTTTIDGGARAIYFKAFTSAMELDHADIEIADGGTFTSSSIFVENGKLYKRVDTCKTYVDDVNECILYQSDNTPCQFHHGDGSLYPSTVTGYLSKDYGKDPTKLPTDTQYELTSKYKFIENPVGSGKYEPAPNWSDIKYYYGDVDHATFDLKLYLEPTKSELYQYDPVTDGWTYMGTVPVPDENELNRNVDHVLFELNHTAVVDAYNKCPMHNGLDFSVKTNYSKVQVQATKELLNGSLQGDDFEFEIVEFAGTADEHVITSTKNDANGNISFDIMSFDKPGTHYFTIREKKDPSKTNIHFDTREYELIVDIISNDGLLEASIILPNKKLSDVDFKFSNSVLMKLPNTGGIGTIPFYVGGGLLLTIAVLLLIKKKVLDKKKEIPKGVEKNE